MNEVSKIALPELNVSRRTFVGGAAGLTFSMTVTGLVSEAAAATGRDGDNTVNAYVTIRPRQHDHHHVAGCGNGAGHHDLPCR